MKQEKKQNKKMKTRVILVLLFIALFSVISYISLRGSYLEYKELGENYLQTFLTKEKYYYCVLISNFALVYLIMYFSKRILYVLYSNNRKNGDLLADALRKSGFDVPDKNIINIGATIGSHIGPNACGVAYISED